MLVEVGTDPADVPFAVREVEMDVTPDTTTCGDVLDRFLIYGPHRCGADLSPQRVAWAAGDDSLAHAACPLDTNKD
jgi:hypothetical protein